MTDIVDKILNQSAYENGLFSEQESDKTRLSKLINRLYYIEHKDVVNSNRKKYKRQAWADRKDNPKNKGSKDNV